MGMDVVSTTGEEYFRANLTSWAAILSACEEAGWIVPAGWHVNQGEGLNDPRDCSRLADLLIRWMERHTSDVYEPEGVESPQARALISMFAEMGLDAKPNDPQARTSTEHLRQWIAFLQRCTAIDAGFEIH